MACKDMPDSNVSSSGVIVALPADLIFGARIRAAAQQAGATVVLAKNPADLLEQLRRHQARLIILDLDRRGMNITDVVREIKAISASNILAYASHVREDAIREAREAGADRVMARGAFAGKLAEILSDHV